MIDDSLEEDLLLLDWLILLTLGIPVPVSKNLVHVLNSLCTSSQTHHIP